MQELISEIPYSSALRPTFHTLPFQLSALPFNEDPVAQTPGNGVVSPTAHQCK